MILNSAILEISKNRLIHNYNFFKKINKGGITSVTIKADAYGLGATEIYKILYGNGCRNFFVATVTEGIELRKNNNGGSIYILNGTENNKLKIFKKNNLIPIINNLEEINLIKKHNLNFGLHVDTGINRLGLNINNIDKKLSVNKKLKIIISHLSSADEYKNLYNNFQRNKFINLINYINNYKIIYSLSNSHGALISKHYLFNMIRPGIGIYGGHNNTRIKKYLKPVIKLKAKILQIKKINKNEYIGYNQTYITNKKTWIAIIGIGYADGIKRILSNNGYIYFKNNKYKILGRISMDSITVDITKNFRIFKTGGYVELINYKNGIDKFANKCQTISHEILTSISKRVERKYV